MIFPLEIQRHLCYKKADSIVLSCSFPKKEIFYLSICLIRQQDSNMEDILHQGHVHGG